KKDGSENIITVHVDRTRYSDSRWYTGSGIYRNVELITVDKLHIPIWGTFITTPEITDEKALVNLEVTVKNQTSNENNFSLSTVILNQKGTIVAETADDLSLSPLSDQKYIQQFEVLDPERWDLDNPVMYKAVTKISREGKLVDQYETPFGVRSLRFDNEEGFFLNEKNTYVKGVCLHHDGGLVGAAVPKGVWKRRLEILKEGGVNAIRLSHNPFSEDFLQLCDELGLLVQDEIFDEMDNPKDKRYNLNEREVNYETQGYTEHFQEWGKSDLTRTILRDRNHPSVFQWSIGNEIEWTYPDYKHVSGLWDENDNYWNKIPTLTPEEMKARYEALPEREYVLAETAKRLSGWVKELDTSRPVTANLIIPVASLATGYADALDVVGFSYQIAQYDWSKKNYPDMHFTGNENTGLLEEWQSVLEKPYVFSMYMWTGIDYMGESYGDWPQKAWHGDMVDLAGFTKPGFYNFKSIWVDEPQVSIFTVPLSNSDFKLTEDGILKAKSKSALKWKNYHSHPYWNYEEGEQIVVEVRSNLPEVELFHNEVSLGNKLLSDCPDRIFRWAVPFKAGNLIAKASDGDVQVESQLVTASEPTKINVVVDKNTLKADGYDVAHLIVQLTDQNGNPVSHMEKEISFEIKGDVSLLGVDNGWSESVQAFQTNSVVTHYGKCLAIIQSNRVNSGVEVTISGPGLESTVAEMTVK
ncbi:MAG: glycoside hydrolase family 2 TIM barrel-domain containing protein, partial [Bacteroidota bacterium]